MQYRDSKRKVGRCSDYTYMVCRWTIYEEIVKTKEEVINYGLAYNEHRIHNEQVTELMLTYLEELDGLMNKFHEIEKASLSTDQSESNANVQSIYLNKY